MFKTIIQLRRSSSISNDGSAASGVELGREDSEVLLVSAKYKLKDIYDGNVADPRILPGDRITVKH